MDDILYFGLVFVVITTLFWPTLGNLLG